MGRWREGKDYAHERISRGESEFDVTRLASFTCSSHLRTSPVQESISLRVAEMKLKRQILTDHVLKQVKNGLASRWGRVLDSG
jgi:hypothetical protein